MSVQGATPFSATSRRIGTGSRPVRQVRTQSLRVGDVVLVRQKRCTVLADAEKNSDGNTWRVLLSQPDGTDRVIPKPPGFTWAVLDN